MINRFDPGAVPSDEMGRDMELAEALGALDPESLDPNYWFRFKGWVLTEAGPELARRRLMADLTVVDLLTSWSRTIVPTALVAAVMAGIVLLRAGTLNFAPMPGPVEVVAADFEVEPVLLSPDAAAGIVAFAADTY
jgi:hypothetical protein